VKPLSTAILVTCEKKTNDTLRRTSSASRRLWQNFDGLGLGTFGLGLSLRVVGLLTYFGKIIN